MKCAFLRVFFQKKEAKVLICSFLEIIFFLSGVASCTFLAPCSYTILLMLLQLLFLLTQAGRAVAYFTLFCFIFLAFAAISLSKPALTLFILLLPLHAPLLFTIVLVVIRNSWKQSSSSSSLQVSPVFCLRQSYCALAGATAAETSVNCLLPE